MDPWLLPTKLRRFGIRIAAHSSVQKMELGGVHTVASNALFTFMITKHV